MKKFLSTLAVLGIVAVGVQSANAFCWSNLNPANWGHCKCQQKCDPCGNITGGAANCDPCKKKQKCDPCQKQVKQPCNPCQTQKTRQNCDPCDQLQQMNK